MITSELTPRPSSPSSEPRSRRVPTESAAPLPPSPTLSSPPVPPRSPLRPPARSLSLSSPPPPMDLPSMHSLLTALDDDKALPSSPSATSLASSSDLPQQQTFTKRQHALLELLSSERAYASDLALIRTVHIPLALGQTVPLHQTPPSPPNSSASSSRTLSTSSDSSIAALGPPMTHEDVKLIFNNISELAVFSDLLCEELEEALGGLLEGGVGEDSVGSLFLRIIPDLERPYKHYITRHSNAVTHLSSLPSTPALQAYLTHTQTIASTHSHAWDLSSLLIKPVQRLLKYPLLLSAIIDETPDVHPDKENLKLARGKLEQVARNVNEGRRRAEVIKDVLSGGKKKAGVGVSASVGLTKMKSLRYPRSAENEEAALVERMQGELRRADEFTQRFARNVVDWAKMTSNVVLALRAWAVSFGKVIGLSPDQESEAFNAFVSMVEGHLMPLCVRLEAVINERLLKEIAHLLMTMNQPLKLLASMTEQEPYHYHLMTMNLSKTRPPQALLAASTNYLALRGQLAAELPSYVDLLHRGLAVFVRRLAEIQTDFWGDVRGAWAELWEMLRVEGEWNAGCDETVNVWCARWAEVDEVVRELSIVQRRKIYQDPVRLSVDSSGSAGKKRVANVLASLEPVHVVSGPFPLTPRARGNSDASTGGRRMGRRVSSESLRSGRSSRKTRSPRREDVPDVPFLPRVQSMALSERERPVRPSASRSTTATTMEEGRPATSRSTTTHAEDGHAYAYPRAPDSAPVQYHDFDRDRGRSHTSPTSSSASKRKETPPRRRPRSGSGSVSFPPSQDSPPMPNKRDSWATRPAKYVCQVIHPCHPPGGVSYFSFPFFTLNEGEFYEVLQEAGHPSIHPKLPLYVDEGEDCLLLCRDVEGSVGWALASFLEPVHIPR